MTDATDKAGTLACPFCGGEAARDTWDAGRDYAGCRECDFWTLYRIWQKRTPSPSSEAGMRRAEPGTVGELQDLLAELKAYGGRVFVIKL